MVRVLCFMLYIREVHPFPLRVKDDNNSECQYVGDWGDCDPFKMIRVKEERLVIGGVQCEARKNITKPCSRDDFPPGMIQTGESEIYKNFIRK